MSNQINQYSKTRTAATFQLDDLVDIDSTDDGGGSYESAKATLEELLNFLSTQFSSFYNQDGVLSGPRIVDNDENLLSFKNGSVSWTMTDFVINQSSSVSSDGIRIRDFANIEVSKWYYDQPNDDATLQLFKGGSRRSTFKPNWLSLGNAATAPVDGETLYVAGEVLVDGNSFRARQVTEFDEVGYFIYRDINSVIGSWFYNDNTGYVSLALRDFGGSAYLIADNGALLVQRTAQINSEVFGVTGFQHHVTSNYVFNGDTTNYTINNNTGPVLELTTGGGMKIGNFNDATGAPAANRKLDSYFSQHNFYTGRIAANPNGLYTFGVGQNQANNATYWKAAFGRTPQLVDSALELYYERSTPIVNSSRNAFTITDAFTSVFESTGLVVKTLININSNAGPVWQNQDIGDAEVRGIEIQLGSTDDTLADFHTALYTNNGDIVVQNGQLYIAGTATNRTGDELLYVNGRGYFSGCIFSDQNASGGPSSGLVMEADNGEIRAGTTKLLSSNNTLGFTDIGMWSTGLEAIQFTTAAGTLKWHEFRPSRSYNYATEATSGSPTPDYLHEITTTYWDGSDAVPTIFQTEVKNQLPGGNQAVTYRLDGLALMQMFSDGRISMPNLPTASAGLPAGSLWNDSGTLKIV